MANPWSSTAPTDVLYRLSDRFTIGNGCWEWNGKLTDSGYPMLVHFKGRRTFPYRVLYELLVGPIPEGLELDHLCVNPICLRPDHLEPVTHSENARRVGLRRTHCPQGHPYDEANTSRKTSNGSRRCKVCHRERERERRATDLKYRERNRLRCIAYKQKRKADELRRWERAS